jgi:hypothetical protein
MDIISAKVAQVPFGNLSVEGLLLEDGKFAISLQQVASLFQLLPNSIQKAMQDRLGNGCSFYQIKTNREKVKGKRVRSKENAISLLDFERFLRALDKANNLIAVNMTDALVGLSLTQIFSDAFEIEITKEQRQQYIENRILDTPDPWEKMYEKEACLKAFTWYGAEFYWVFCYQWMSKEEQCKLNAINPCIKGNRKAKIHQYIEPETKERLTPYVRELCVLLDVCNSRQEFATKYAKRYGAVQTELLAA